MPNRLLVAYDESPQARAALQHAIETYPEATLVVMHVSDPREWVFGDDMGGYYSEDAFDQAQASAEELLEGAAALAEEADVAVETVSEIGQPAHAITEYAEEHDIDHVVVGSHGRRGLSRFLLGSVAETIVRRAPASVTVIRDVRTG